MKITAMLRRPRSKPLFAYFWRIRFTQNLLIPPFMSPKFIHTALWVVFALSVTRCQNAGSGKNPDPVYVYENEYGSIRILPKNSTHKRVIYANNNGETLDTLLEIDRNMDWVSPDSAYPFLGLKMGGVEWNAEYARIHEFSGLAFLGQYVPIEQMYERRFFRTDTPITVSGYLTRGKAGTQIDGIYLKNAEPTELRFATVHGAVKKEPYPRAYYSTDDSPQGMFSDNQVHYRLVMENYVIGQPTVQRLTGRALNVGGQAHLVWDFADSESYRLEGRAPWTKEDEHKKITVEGVLFQDREGSVLKDWKVVPE